MINETLANYKLVELAPSVTDLAKAIGKSACENHPDPDIFFPAKDVITKSVRVAKAICASCAVSTDCLEGALNREEEFGIWGGLIRREREKILRNRHRLQLVPKLSD